MKPTIIEDGLQPRSPGLIRPTSGGRAIVYILMGGVGGRIPTVSSFYDINAAGEKRYTAGCSMNAEADVTIQLSGTTSVVFWGPAERKSSYQEILSLSITVAALEKVSLTKASATVAAKGYKVPLEIPITTVRRAAAVTSPSCEPPSDAFY